MKDTIINELTRLANEANALQATASQARFAALKKILTEKEISKDQTEVMRRQLALYAAKLQEMKTLDRTGRKVKDAELSLKLDEDSQGLAQVLKTDAPRFASAPQPTTKNNVGKNLLGSILGLVKNLANPQADIQQALIGFFADFMKVLVNSFTGMVRQYAGEEAGKTMEEIGKQIPAVVTRMMGEESAQKQVLEKNLQRAEFDHAARQNSYTPAMHANTRVKGQSSRVNLLESLQLANKDQSQANHPRKLSVNF